jgi:ribosomal protein L14
LKSVIPERVLDIRDVLEAVLVRVNQAYGRPDSAFSEQDVSGVIM